MNIFVCKRANINKIESLRNIRIMKQKNINSCFIIRRLKAKQKSLETN